MINLVLYRKYRPKSFSEIVGQEHIIRTLTNSLKLERIGHAYLFCGPRGTGKTTTARLFAKAVNCIQINGSEPCNKCHSCTEINESRALDLIEIDAASNRGIDEIRELRDGIKFSPTSNKYKVFIIDEAHMLTKEAFNALLKMLEESPVHAIFILATTEPHKLPATILSRVQRFDFRRLAISELLKKLEHIVEKEKIKIHPDALRLVATSATGSSRDAESVLDQLRVAFPEKIELEAAQKFLGLVDVQKIKNFVNLLASGDLAQSVGFIKDLNGEGEDLGQFVKLSLEYLRKVFFAKVDENLVKNFSEEIGKDITAEIQNQAQKFSLEEITKIINVLMAATQDLKKSPIPALPLELAVFDIFKIKNKKI